MFRALTLAVLALALGPAEPAAAQKTDCGNAPLSCIAMFGLSQSNAPDRQYAEKIYQTLYDNADNDRAKLFNNKLATAYHEVLKKADDPNFQFWVIIVNPTDRKQTGKLSIVRSPKTIDFTSGLDGVYLNCDLDNSLCPPSKTSTPTFNQVWNDIHENVEEIQREFNEEFEPRSASVRGFHVGVPDDADAADAYSVALLGGAAAGRLKPDRNDVLRVGVVNGSGKTPDFGEVKRFDDGCALFATFKKRIDETPSDERDNPFGGIEKYCLQWIVQTNSSCNDTISYAHRQKHRDSDGNATKTGFIEPGEVKPVCGGESFFSDDDP
jgi:hypothetical protein